MQPVEATPEEAKGIKGFFNKAKKLRNQGFGLGKLRQAKNDLLAKAGEGIGKNKNKTQNKSNN